MQQEMFSDKALTQMGRLVRDREIGSLRKVRRRVVRRRGTRQQHPVYSMASFVLGGEGVKVLAQRTARQESRHSASGYVPAQGAAWRRPAMRAGPRRPWSLVLGLGVLACRGSRVQQHLPLPLLLPPPPPDAPQAQADMKVKLAAAEAATREARDETQAAREQVKGVEGLGGGSSR